MSSARRTDRFAAVVAIMLAWASVGSASAQTRLNVILTTFPVGRWCRRPVRCGTPALTWHSLACRRLRRVLLHFRRNWLITLILTHVHDPHVHFTASTGWLSGSSGVGNPVGIFSMSWGGSRGSGTTGSHMKPTMWAIAALLHS